MPTYGSDYYQQQQAQQDYQDSLDESYAEDFWENLWKQYLASINTGIPGEGETHFMGYTDTGDASAIGSRRYYSRDPGTGQTGYSTTYDIGEFTRFNQASGNAWNPFQSKFYRGGRGGYDDYKIRGSAVNNPYGTLADYKAAKDQGTHLDNLINSMQNSEWASMGYQTPEWLKNLLPEDEQDLVKPINS